MKKLFLIMITFSLITLGACSSGPDNDKKEASQENTTHQEHGNGKNSGTAHDDAGHNEPNHGKVTDDNPLGDIREETASIDKLPEFLHDKPENMQLIYTAVAKSQDLLESIPCYCGCGESANHKNNYDCFIYKNNKDGSLTWDDHATKCQACLDIAVKAINEHHDGKPIREIRNMIDAEYKDGYPAPTPTPEV